MINLICAEGTGSVGNIIIWVVLIVALVFMLIFPTFTQRKRNKQYEQMIQGIRVGDTVRTAGGVIGRVVRVTKKGEITTVTLETGTKSEKSYTEFDMNFINCVLKSTRTEENQNAQVEVESEDNKSEINETSKDSEKEPESAEISSSVSDITPENSETVDNKEPKKSKPKSAVKKTAKKTAKK